MVETMNVVAVQLFHATCTSTEHNKVAKSNPTQNEFEKFSCDLFALNDTQKNIEHPFCIRGTIWVANCDCVRVRVFCIRLQILHYR